MSGEQDELNSEIGRDWRQRLLHTDLSMPAARVRAATKARGEADGRRRRARSNPDAQGGRRIRHGQG